MKSFLIADDHTVVRHGMSLIIGEMFKDACVHQTGSLPDVLEILKVKVVDLLLLDVTFPEGNSLNIVREAKMIQPSLKILVFSAYEEEQYAVRFINMGADGYLSKLSTSTEIKEAIRIIITQGRFVSQKVRDKIVDSFIKGSHINPIEKLSNKEMEISNLLIQGYGNLEISNMLNIQKSTVSTFKKRIFEKLQITNVVSLVEIFRSNQIG
jgi:DNA-binding NarL/FixJ family response regulator